ncbi:fumarylacetoacetate hydrolase family protein [Burkholderia sp. MR1-5-21]
MTAPAGLLSPVERLAGLLAETRGRGAFAALDSLPAYLQPACTDEAYAVQHATLRAMRSAPAGWKIGSKSHDGPIQGAPLPASTVHRSPAMLACDAFVKPGLELEIAFVLGRRFKALSGPCSDDAVLDGIASVHAAIEVVASRFSAWPNVDKLWQLADLQNHGALILGEGVPYDPCYPFVAPAMHFTFDGKNVVEGKPANPAGDPRRLPGWLVRHCLSRGLTLEPGCVLTCGSYTGMYFPGEAGVARGAIEGLPPVELMLA